MNPFDFYREIIASITESDTRKVAVIMLQHVGEENLIELKDLCIQSFGDYSPATDRKTRLILADLVEKHKLPVGAYSGKSGRWLCLDDAEKQRVIQDLEARTSSIQDRIRNMRLSRTPPKKFETGTVQQRNFWQ
jgi:hypothetical protein